MNWKYISAIIYMIEPNTDNLKNGKIFNVSIVLFTGALG